MKADRPTRPSIDAAAASTVPAQAPVPDAAAPPSSPHRHRGLRHPPSGKLGGLPKFSVSKKAPSPSRRRPPGPRPMHLQEGHDGDGPGDLAAEPAEHRAWFRVGGMGDTSGLADHPAHEDAREARPDPATKPRAAMQFSVGSKERKRRRHPGPGKLGDDLLGDRWDEEVQAADIGSPGAGHAGPGAGAAPRARLSDVKALLQQLADRRQLARLKTDLASGKMNPALVPLLLLAQLQDIARRRLPGAGDRAA